MRIELTCEIDGKKVNGLEGAKRLADAGNIEALNLLGEWLLTGFECTPDANLAFGCFEKAARAGNTRAMLNLGKCYIEGHGTLKDFYAAERWIRAADELGNREAENACKDLYLSSVGSHRPSLRAFVDYEYSKNPTGNAKTAKKHMMNYLVLKGAGKSDSETKALIDKVTQNDIVAYESMNDLYYNDSDEVEPEIEVDREQYIRKILADIKSHRFVLREEDSSASEDNTEIIPQNERERKNIALYFRLLYHLSAEDNDSLDYDLRVLGKACSDELDVTKKPTWYERAMFDVNPDIKYTFSESELSECFDAVCEYLLEIQNSELSAGFDKCPDNQTGLRFMRAALATKRNIFGAIIGEVAHSELKHKKTVEKTVHTDYQYGKQLDEWDSKISDRLCELDDAMLSKLFDEARNDYDSLVELHGRIIDEGDEKDDDDDHYILVEKSIKSKWLEKISERLRTVQTDCLEKVCGTISGLDYTALVALYDDSKDRYSFHSDILDKYLAIIAKPIDEHENSVLETLCANTDDLPSAEYERIIDEINKLNFKECNTKKYLDDISQKLSNARLLESCEERYLEDYDLDQLNDRVKAVHFSTFSSEIKSELNGRITRYIDLIYDCKDKKTVKLLSDCEPENAEKLSVEELSAIFADLQNHPRLSPEIRDELTERVKEKIHIKEFERVYITAGDDYDLLLSANEALPHAKLPKAEEEKYAPLLYNKILAAQKKALAGLTAVPSDEKHDGILGRIKRAKHFDIDKTVLDDALTSLNATLDDFECGMLQRICGCIDACTWEELEAIEEKIKELNFREKNVEPFEEKIYDCYEELNFKELTEKCTMRGIAEVAKEDGLKELLKELQDCDKDNAVLEPYIRRVKAYMAVRAQLKADISVLYKKHSAVLQKYIAEKISGFIASYDSTFESYCEFEKKKIDEIKALPDLFELDEHEQIEFLYKPWDDSYDSCICITNLAIHYYYKKKKKHIPLESITDIYVKGVFDIYLYVSGGNEDFFTCMLSKKAICLEFAKVLHKIVLVGCEQKRQAQAEKQSLTAGYSDKYRECFMNNPIPNEQTGAERNTQINREATGKGKASVNSTSQPAGTQPGAVGDVLPWVCGCGRINQGKFCPGCGAKKETGTPMWKCSCGNVNKGKFCTKCGSKRPD